MASINLEKREANRVRLLKESDVFVQLDKKVEIALEKAGLRAHAARVSLCLDISASMGSLFRSGKIQSLIERLLTLAVRFDDDGAIDVFTFGSEAHVEDPVTLDNF